MLKPQESISVLYIEDDLGLATLVRKKLEKLSFKFAHADRFKTGLDMLREGTFDCLLLDIHLPDGNGMLFLRQLKSSSIKLPVIIVSGMGDQKIAVDCLKAGAYDYISKDVDMNFIDFIPIVIQQTLDKENLKTEKESLFLSLTESEEKYRHLVFLSDDGIFLCADDGKIEFINPAGKLMFDLNEFENPGALKLNFFELFQLKTRSWQEFSGNIWLEKEVDTPHGRTYFEIKAHRLKYKGVMMQQVLVRNVSERKNIEDQLVQYAKQLQFSNRELERFASVVANELKSPLSFINRIAEILNEIHGEKLHPEVGHMLTEMQDNISYMYDLINSILDYSKLKSVKDENHSRHSLKDILDELLSVIPVPEHIKISVSGVFPSLKGSKVRYYQLFENLIMNAIRHHDKPDGTVEVVCSEQDNNYLFAVKDNGPGIAEEHQEQVFELFKTLDGDEERKSPGIGLAVVKTIVEKYKGKIWIESEEGKGSVFYFTLPK